MTGLTADVTTSGLPVKLRAYARLAKLDAFDYYLALPVALAALPAAQRLTVAVPTVLVPFLAGTVLIVAAGVAFDDLTGYRDGSDLANYGPDAPARRLARKPLLAGALRPVDALRFGWATAVLGLALWVVAAAVAPHRPGWVLVLGVLTAVVAVQYSYGLRLSYHGFQEIFLAALGWAFVLLPYGLLHGSVTGFVAVQAFLFGLGPMLFGVYSNTNDVPGDRAVGRPTVAALTSARGNALFVAAVSALEYAAILGGPVLGLAPWWFPVAMLPTMVLRATQYRIGFVGHDILRARRLGIRTHRVTAALLVLVDLAAMR